jgi:hypothetical protein
VNGKSQKRRIGDIVKIPLGDGTHTYARVLPEASFAFYDSRGTEELEINRIVDLPILFFTAVMNHAIKSGRWKVVGHISRDDGLRAPPQFIQDPLDKRSFSIYEDGKIRPATRQECVGLECAAVWEPEHVEVRLRDHYAGRKNEEVESLRMTSFRPN